MLLNVLLGIASWLRSQGGTLARLSLVHDLFRRSDLGSAPCLLQTGASLKLTILNPKGRIWTMVAGGGASVIYTDTVSLTRAASSASRTRGAAAPQDRAGLLTTASCPFPTGPRIQQIRHVVNPDPTSTEASIRSCLRVLSAVPGMSVRLLCAAQPNRVVAGARRWATWGTRTSWATTPSTAGRPARTRRSSTRARSWT